MIAGVKIILLACSMMVVSACSLNHGAPDLGVDSDNSNKTISGVVAAGAPVRGTVILKNANSANTYLASVIEPDGHFSIHLVDTMTGPYILQARGTVGGRSVCLHTMGTRSNVSDIVNITPLTDLIVGHLTGQAPERYFDAFDDPPLSRIATDQTLDRHEALFRSRFLDLIDSVGVDAGGFNLFNTPFEADHTGLDAVLDMIRVIPQWTDAGERLDTLILRNILTGEELVEDLTDTTETDGFSAMAPDVLDAFIQAMIDIDDLFQTWAQGFEGSSPDPSEDGLIDLFAEEFLFNGYDRQTFLEKICADSGLIGMTFSGISVDAIDTVDGTAVVSLTVSNTDGRSQILQNWALRRSAEQWLICGNQQLLDVHAGAYAAYDQTSRIVLVDGVGIGLYAIAPVVDRVTAVDHITVTGPGIPTNQPVILSRQGGTPPVFAQTDSQPQGFYQPIDDQGTPSPLRVTDNSCYTFILYDALDNPLNPGGYTRVLPRGYGNTQTLMGRISHHAASFSKPYFQRLSEFTGNDPLICEWTLPARVKAQALFFQGTNQARTVLLSDDLAPLATMMTRMIIQDDIETFDIYLRTVDEYDRIMDTFLSKTISDSSASRADSLIGMNRRLF